MFQRYYELIRHQKNHCFKEENNKKSAKAQIAAAQISMEQQQQLQQQVSATSCSCSRYRLCTCEIHRNCLFVSFFAFDKTRT